MARNIPRGSLIDRGKKNKHEYTYTGRGRVYLKEHYFSFTDISFSETLSNTFKSLEFCQDHFYQHSLFIVDL